MRSLIRQLAACLIGIGLAMPAQAQLACKESSSDRGTVQCDMTYRNTNLNCKSGTIFPPCYKDAMPMKSTAKQTFKDVSPYLYAYPRDPDDRSRPYSGIASRGQIAGPSDTFAPVGEPPKGVSKQKACSNQIVMKVDSLEDEAKLARLQLDNCANQYILNTAVDPFFKENSQLLCATKDNPSKRCGQEDLCQPLRMLEDSKQEYLPSDYIKAAWIKLLQDPSYRKNKDAKDEPHLPDGVKLNSKLDPPNISEIRINQLAAAPYEEIIDPTHPYSPRWDYSYNERDKYSPKTKDYGGDPQNGVFCAGDKNSKIYKVDVLTFREKALNFDKHISDRIDFNKNCMANSGMQANPCCKVHRNSPNPMTWTCTLQPCAKCYAMTADSPVCSTDYANPTDRKKVKSGIIGGYLPVHPSLRIAGALSALSPASLAAMPAQMLNSQVQAALGAKLNLLNQFNPATLIKNAVPMLTAQLNLNNLISGQIGNITAQLNISNLGQFAQFAQIMQAPQQLLGQLNAAMPMGQLQSVIGGINGQLNIVANIPGLNLNQAFAGMNSINGLLGSMNPTSLLSNAQGSLKGMMNMFNGLPKGLTIGGAQDLFNQQIQQLSGLSSSTLLSQLPSSVRAQLSIPGITGLGGNLTVGDATNILKSQRDSMGNFNANVTLSSLGGSVPKDVAKLFGNAPTDLSLAGAQQLIGNQIAQLQGLPGNMTLDAASAKLGGTFSIPGFGSISGNIPVSDALKMLNVQSASLSGINFNLPMSQFTGMLNGQIGQILQLPGNLQIGDIGGMFNGMQNMLGGLTNQLPFGQLQGMIGGQLNNLLKLPGIANVGQLGNLVGSQLSMLNGLMPTQLQGILNGQLGNLSSLMNGQLGALTGQLAGLQNLLGSQLSGITAQFGNISNMLSSTLGGLSGQLSSITGALGSQLAGLQGMLNLPIGQLSGLISSQLGQLASFAGNLPIGQLSGLIDGSMFGNIAGLANLANLPGMGAISNILSGNFLANIPGLNVLNALTSPPLPYLVVKGMYFPRTAKCNPNEFGSANTPPMATLCKQLRAPYVPINKLKMRYYNPDDKDNMTLKSGVQEGLWFKDYFYDKDAKMAHMPYPRLWDTGRSIQKSESPDQDPNDINGQYTAIVGVGREAATDAVNNSRPEGKKHNEERCLYGGWGGDTKIGDVNIKVPDPITSWTELKLYQAYTTRETNTVCIGRYDKAFRYRGTESQLLVKSGAINTGVVETQCERDDKGKIKLDTCKRTELADIKDGDSSKSQWKNLQYLQDSNPMSWRGYFSSTNDATRFPKLGGDGSIEKGLDKARCGDIIMMPKGASEGDAKPGLPKLARVSCWVDPKTGEKQSAIRCQNGKNCFIDVEEADNGKWPDVCGTTDSMGELRTRRIYKPGNLRKEIADELERIKWTGSCEDTKLAECEMKPWNDLEVYHIQDDTRQGYTGSK